LTLTSYLWSGATSNLRATSRSSRQIYVRGTPCVTTETVYFERPLIEHFSWPFREEPHRNPYAQAKCWALSLRDAQKVPLSMATLPLLATMAGLFSDRDFVLAAISNGSLALQFVDEQFRSDRGVVLAALEQDASAIDFVDESLKSDESLVSDSPRATK